MMIFDNMENNSESFTEINLITVIVIFCCAAFAGCAIFFLQEVTCGTKIFFKSNIDPNLNEKIYIIFLIYLISIHFLYFGLTRDFLKLVPTNWLFNSDHGWVRTIPLLEFFCSLWELELGY